MKRISVGSAVLVGTLWVNIPVIPIMFTPSFLFLIIAQPDKNHQPTAFVLSSLLSLFGLGFVLAWSWWSLMVPRWRLWAWQRVEDLNSLKQRAVGAGLIWPDGHVFEKTELRSKETQEKLRALESRKRPHA